jgi:hypothetical protein
LRPSATGDVIKRSQPKEIFFLRQEQLILTVRIFDFVVV